MMKCSFQIKLEFLLWDVKRAQMFLLLLSMFFMSVMYILMNLEGPNGKDFTLELEQLLQVYLS